MCGFISRRAGAYHNLVIYGEELLVVLKYQEVLNGVTVGKIGKAVPVTGKDVRPWKRMFQARNARLLAFQQVYEATLDTPDKREFIQVGLGLSDCLESTGQHLCDSSPRVCNLDRVYQSPSSSPSPISLSQRRSILSPHI